MVRTYIDRGQMETTVAEEKQYNPRLSKDIDTFVQIMENLNLPKPKMIGKLVYAISRLAWLPHYKVCFKSQFFSLILSVGT